MGKKIKNKNEKERTNKNKEKYGRPIRNRKHDDDNEDIKNQSAYCWPSPLVATAVVQLGYHCFSNPIRRRPAAYNGRCTLTYGPHRPPVAARLHHRRCFYQFQAHVSCLHRSPSLKFLSRLRPLMKTFSLFLQLYIFCNLEIYFIPLCHLTF